MCVNNFRVTKPKCTLKTFVSDSRKFAVLPSPCKLTSREIGVKENSCTFNHQPLMMTVASMMDVNKLNGQSSSQVVLP